MTHWRTPNGKSVTSNANWPAALKVVEHPQRRDLETVIKAAEACRHDADRGNLRGSHAEMALLNALYTLLQIDALYDAAGEIERDLGLGEQEVTRSDLEEWDADRRQGRSAT